MTRIRLAPRASADLEQIENYSFENFGASVAGEYISGINGVFDLLVRHPEVGKLDNALGNGIRRYAYRSHCLYYRIMGDEVVVGRILHGAMDPARHLN